MANGDYPWYGYGVMNPYYQYPQPAYTLAGWKCPGCQRCYSPSVIACPECPRQEVALPVTRVNTGPLHDLCITPCPPSAEGGTCGCEDGDDTPAARDCNRARCDH